MRHWHSLLQESLRLDWLGPSAQAVPFRLTGVLDDRWTAEALPAARATRWTLRGHTPEGLEAVWEAEVFDDTRALECWGQVTHRGPEPVRNISECLTLNLDLPLSPAFGQPWVRSVNGVRFIPNFFPPHDFAVVDRQLLDTPQVYTPLTLTGMEDGRPSGENLPCAILGDERQTCGLALFLEWSGLWRVVFAQQRRTSTLCVQAGLRGLHLDLQPGQSLPLPRLLLVAFDGDLESGGNALRHHIRRHVAPKLNGQEVLPPTSFNHWFAFNNEFTAEGLKPAVEACGAAGLEYFCVDAGWFPGNFRNGIGHWEEDRTKFPEGIGAFARWVRAHGMQYGTWSEPEWAHEASPLYRQHPDWFWRTPSQMADTLFVSPKIHLLNFGLREVRQWWLDRLVRAYEEWGVRWIRWDFNQTPRPNWEQGAPAGALGWRQIAHVTGLYAVLDELQRVCPELFIEQCASGGHRIELGTVRRGHSFWMNDHTTHSDIVRALQHGLNTVLPGNYANTNLCQNRHDLTDYDFLSHGAGGFGYSGRLWEAPKPDFARYREAVARFKRYRPLLLGEYHRPTGQPARATDYAKVVFADGGKSVTMEFNPPGKSHTAFLT